MKLGIVLKHKCKEISQLGDKIFLQRISHEIYGQFIDNSFDFVYMMGHDYESVKRYNTV